MPNLPTDRLSSGDVMRSSASLALLILLVAACGSVESASQTRTASARPSEVSAAPSAPAAGDDMSALLPAPWFDAEGRPAERGEGANRTWEVTNRRGVEHCDTQSVLFMTVAWPLGTTYTRTENLGSTRQYVRDPEGRIGSELLRGTLELGAELPRDSTDTGYHTDHVELWLGPDGGDQYIYLLHDEQVERLPRAVEPIGCE